MFSVMLRDQSLSVEGAVVKGGGGYLPPIIALLDVKYGSIDFEYVGIVYQYT